MIRFSMSESCLQSCLIRLKMPGSSGIPNCSANSNLHLMSCFQPQQMLVWANRLPLIRWLKDQIVQQLRVKEVAPNQWPCPTSSEKARITSKVCRLKSKAKNSMMWRRSRKETTKRSSRTFRTPRTSITKNVKKLKIMTSNRLSPYNRRKSSKFKISSCKPRVKARKISKAWSRPVAPWKMSRSTRDRSIKFTWRSFGTMRRPQTSRKRELRQRLSGTWLGKIYW